MSCNKNLTKIKTDCFITDYVYSTKAKFLNEIGERFERRETAKAEVVDNAVILPVVNYNDYDVMHGRGGVVDSNGVYVESSITKARIKGSYSVEEYDIDTIDEKVVYCGYYYKAWGHFITEVVSRLWYALQNDDSVDSYVFIDLINGEEKTFSGNYLEFFKLLGISDKVKLINKPVRYRTVVIPEDGFVYDSHYTNGFRKMYEYIAQKGLELYNGAKYDKVYFSKRKLDSSIKTNLNDKSIEKFFKKNGYKVFYPEKLSLIDTIGIMQNAKLFAGIASSLLHNQLFGHANQTTICIEKNSFSNPYQVMVAKITECKTIFIDACWTIFTVSPGGPFIFDYTNFLIRFAKDHGMVIGKPMSKLQFKRIFRKYLAYYFDINNKLPPDWMYSQYFIDMTREAYDDAIRSHDSFKLSFFERIKLKFEKLKRKYFN